MSGRVLVIDNYDSFTYNLVQYLGELGADLVTVRNDAVSLQEAIELTPTHIVISPGPGRPENAGISLDVIRHFAAKGIPILGVCLGHQAIVLALGGSIRQLSIPVHGKTSQVFHDGSDLYRGVGSPFTATRYHSLEIAPDLPPSLRVSARTDEGAVMGVRHEALPVEGVQFHPESILTSVGKTILGNFLAFDGGDEERAKRGDCQTDSG